MRFNDTVRNGARSAQSLQVFHQKYCSPIQIVSQLYVLCPHEDSPYVPDSSHDC